MAIQETTHPFEAILSEANGYRSREKVTIPASQTITAGAVLGKITSSGNYVPVAPAAGDGSEVAAAVALQAATTGAGVTADITALVRDCEVNNNYLGWGSLNAGQQATATTQLATANIIVRT